ncbi:MAG: hypothetical protein ACKPKO_59435, partial [Candidatus Fonsibacter sp.]
LAERIKRRLIAAFRDEWSGLVSELLQYLQAEAEDPPVLPPTMTAHAAVGDPIPLRRLEAAATRGKHGGVRAAKDNLVGGPPVPPSVEVDQQIRALYRTEELTAEERARFASLLLQAGQAAPSAAPRLDPRKVTRRVHQLKMVAALGPSGWRNTYIALLIQAKDGPQVLAAWAQAWTQGSISPHLAVLWTHALVRPFYKPNGGIRPIL